MKNRERLAPFGVLELKALRVVVSLGWTEAERAVKQPVDFDLAIRFRTMPQACDTDQLHDTVGYHDLAQIIRQCCEGQSFKLIEHLNRTVYDLLLDRLPEMAHLWVRVTKVSPPIEGLRGGASFALGTWQPGLEVNLHS